MGLPRVPVYVWPPVTIVAVVLLFAILARVAVPPATSSVTGKLAAQLVDEAKQKLDAAKQAALPRQQFELSAQGLAALDTATQLVPQAALEANTRTNVNELRSKLITLRDSLSA